MWPKSEERLLKWCLLQLQSINWESWAALDSQSQTEEPFYDLFMLLKAAAIFQTLFSLVFCTRLPTDTSGNLGSNSVGTWKPAMSGEKTVLLHSLALPWMQTVTSLLFRPTSLPALSSPAAITLSRHKKTVAKMNTISTPTLAPGSVWGNTSLELHSNMALCRATALTMSLELGSRALCSKPNGTAASLYAANVFLAFWCSDYTMCVLFSCALCVVENAFISGQRGLLQHFPLSRWDSQSGDKGLRLIWVTLNLDWGKAAVAAGVLHGGDVSMRTK